MRRIATHADWGQLHGETMTPRNLIRGFEGGAKYGLAIGAACACVISPVVLAAYAAAGIAGAEPMRTGFTAFRLSMGKALVPFMFVYAPSLLPLQFSWTEFITAMASGMLGILALAAAYTGWFRARIGYLGAALLTIGGIALIFNDWRAELFGLVVVVVLGENVLRGKRAERAAVGA